MHVHECADAQARVHAEARLCVSFSIALHITALRQGLSLNWKVALAPDWLTDSEDPLVPTAQCCCYDAIPIRPKHWVFDIVCPYQQDTSTQDSILYTFIKAPPLPTAWGIPVIQEFERQRQRITASL